MDAGYVNARVRGMKRYLMGREEYEKLIGKPDIDAIITELEKTAYREDIERASVQASGIDLIEQALRTNLVRNFRLILRLVADEKFEKHVRVFLEKWDVQNIKTILRGKNIHFPEDEVLACLVPAGHLDEMTLAELVRQPDIRGVIDLLATWDIEYSRPLTEQFEKYVRKRDLAILEYALDRFYYERTLRLFGERSYNDVVVRDLVGTEIDVVNIKNVLRLLRDDVNPEDGKNALVEGGRIFDRTALFTLLQSGSVDDAVRLLKETPYSFIAGLPENGGISYYEKSLDRYLIEQGIRLSRGDPLSVTVVIGYIWAKINEITNIRIISRCKNAYLPEEEIRKEVLYV